MRRNGFTVPGNPILKPLENIERRDAVLNDDGTEAEWPPADAIIGNPPFLGRQDAISLLGQEYVARLRRVYQDRVPGQADHVVYWFVKALRQIENGKANLVGLVSTNSIRRGINRPILDAVTKSTTIFNAHSDEPWIVEGASVRVSIICFGQTAVTPFLDGEPVAYIDSDLEPAKEAVSLRSVRLGQNADIAFVGGQKDGPFDIAGAEARMLLAMPLNPNGRPNSDVIRPWCNGRDLAKRPSDTWIIDFGNMTEAEAALYEAPFEIVLKRVKPHRDLLRDPRRRRLWWIHGRPGLQAKRALGAELRFIATPLTSKHRWFVFLQVQSFPDNTIVLIVKPNYVMLGMLSSRCHAHWAHKSGNFMGVGNDPRYTPTTTFETFPFPEGLSPDIPEAKYAADPRAQRIGAAAKNLEELRNRWLNPANLVQRVPEVVPGFPDRFLPTDDAAAAILRQRTMTNLYNEQPTWLANAHREVDEAVAAAYGWPSDLSDEEVLSRLLALNAERAGGPANDAGSQ